MCAGRREELQMIEPIEDARLAELDAHFIPVTQAMAYEDRQAFTAALYIAYPAIRARIAADAATIAQLEASIRSFYDEVGAVREETTG